jgi:hypothetical protein
VRGRAWKAWRCRPTIGTGDGSSVVRMGRTPEMGALIAPKFEKEGDVELVCGLHLLSVPLTDTGGPGSRPCSTIVRGRAHERARVRVCRVGSDFTWQTSLLRQTTYNIIHPLLLATSFDHCHSHCFVCVRTAAHLGFLFSMNFLCFVTIRPFVLVVWVPLPAGLPLHLFTLFSSLSVHAYHRFSCIYCLRTYEQNKKVLLFIPSIVHSSYFSSYLIFLHLVPHFKHHAPIACWQIASDMFTTSFSLCPCTSLPACLPHASLHILTCLCQLASLIPLFKSPKTFASHSGSPLFRMTSPLSLSLLSCPSFTCVFALALSSQCKIYLLIPSKLSVYSLAPLRCGISGLSKMSW